LISSQEQVIANKLWDAQTLERMITHCNANRKKPAIIPKKDSLSKLLQTFKSVARIKLATLEEIASVIGMKAAKNIKENL
jgi:excinuclease UvrABC nuclease subunit